SIDIDKLLESIELYPEDKIGFYVIKDKLNDRSYVTGVNNVFVNEFLAELGVKLHVCLRQQD
ncbi:MAG: hypothetical protein K2M17_05240, partial [Bacilli bacterium]|nr:hypothetical protein [Bacilli bacterium]